MTLCFKISNKAQSSRKLIQSLKALAAVEGQRQGLRWACKRLWVWWLAAWYGVWSGVYVLGTVMGSSKVKKAHPEPQSSCSSGGSKTGLEGGLQEALGLF